MFGDDNFYQTGDDSDTTMGEKRQKCKDIYDALVKSCEPKILVYDGDVKFFKKVQRSFDCRSLQALYNRHCCLLERSIKK